MEFVTVHNDGLGADAVDALLLVSELCEILDGVPLELVREFADRELPLLEQQLLGVFLEKRPPGRTHTHTHTRTHTHTHKHTNTHTHLELHTGGPIYIQISLIHFTPNDPCPSNSLTFLQFPDIWVWGRI